VEFLPESSPLATRLGLIIVDMLVYLLFFGALTSAIDEALEGRGQGGWLKPFSRSLGRFSDLFWVQIQYMVGCTWRTLLFIVPMIPYAIKYLLASTDAVLAPEGDGTEAFATSARATQGIRWGLGWVAATFLILNLFLTFQGWELREHLSPPVYLLLSVPLDTAISLAWLVFQTSVYRTRLQSGPGICRR
jgi:hypothetical protein